MMKFDKLTIALPLIAGAALTASAIGPSSQGASPESYGKFISKKSASPAKVQAFISESDKKGPMKVQAYAGEGNAEVDKFGQLTIVEQEDFSLLTTGSEEAPDFDTQLEIQQWMIDPETGNIMRDEYNNPIENPDFQYPWNNMKNEYISSENKNWGVGNAYPAGGMLYFPFSQDYPQGKISTPWIDLSANGGTFVLEFKVKVTEEAKSNPNMPAMIIVETAETRGMSPTWDMFEETFVNYENITTEWTTFRLVYQGAGETTLCNIVGQGVAGGMYIDDVKLYTLTPYLATPVMRRHSDFTENSFTLNWNPVEGAEKYLVNIWYDDLWGDREIIAKDAETTSTSYKAEGTNLDDIYYYTVQAVNSEHSSLASMPKELFDIIAPKMRGAKLIDKATHLYEGGVEEVVSAFGYNYFATAKRTAENDGTFTITDEHFTGWSHPLYEDDWDYTKEDPVDDKIVSLYFPTDIGQQGWYGENFMIYKDYICLCPFFYEASYWQQMSCWVSPEFDMSKDGGKISVSMKLAAQWDPDFQNYASCAIALFNWNEELGDYEQVELAYCRELDFDWQDRSIEFTKGSARSKIGFFAVGSYGDLYIDDILITQNYKAGESFQDPFYFSTWQLAEQVWDPTYFEFNVPDRALDCEIYQRAQAVRMHHNAYGGYDGEKESGFADYDFVDIPNSVPVLKETGIRANIRVADGTIMIDNAKGEAVSVTTSSGISINLGNGKDIKYRPDAKGIYVVTIGGNGIKLAI